MLKSCLRTRSKTTFNCFALERIVFKTKQLTKPLLKKFSSMLTLWRYHNIFECFRSLTGFWEVFILGILKLVNLNRKKYRDIVKTLTKIALKFRCCYCIVDNIALLNKYRLKKPGKPAEKHKRMHFNLCMQIYQGIKG